MLVILVLYIHLTGTFGDLGLDIVSIIKIYVFYFDVTGAMKWTRNIIISGNRRTIGKNVR